MNPFLRLMSCWDQICLGLDSRLCSCRIILMTVSFSHLVSLGLFRVRAFLFYRADCRTRLAGCRDGFASSCSLLLSICFISMIMSHQLSLILASSLLILLIYFLSMPFQFSMFFRLSKVFKVSMLFKPSKFFKP